MSAQTFNDQLEQAVSDYGSDLRLDDDSIAEARDLIREWNESESLRGGFTNRYAAGVVAIVAQRANPAYTVRAISNFIDGLDSNEISQYKRKAIEALGVEVEPLHPRELVQSVVDDLSFDEPDVVAQTATNIFDTIDDVDETFISGSSPSTLAGTVVWIAGLACDQHVSQGEVAEYANTTSVSIRSNSRKIFQLFLENDVDPLQFVGSEYSETRFHNQIERAEENV